MAFVVVGLQYILDWTLLSVLKMVRSRKYKALFSSCSSVNYIFQLILLIGSELHVCRCVKYRI
jgi:hypothetical protein